MEWCQKANEIISGCFYQVGNLKRHMMVMRFIPQLLQISKGSKTTKLKVKGLPFYSCSRHNPSLQLII